MSDPQMLGGLPKAVYHRGAFYAFPPSGGKQPIGGPFESIVGARWWIVEYLETSLTDIQREVWQAVMQDHQATRDAGLELGLIEMVLRGRPLEKMTRYLSRRHGARRQIADRRELAAGERA